MKSAIFLLVCILATATATVPAIAAPWPICAGGNRAERRLSCVHDGDTIWFRGTKIRFGRIDAPELDRAACDAERAAAIRARNRLADLLGRGDVHIQPTGARGLYHREIANPLVAGVDVQDVLLEEGLALPYRGGNRAKHREHWCGR